MKDRRILLVAVGLSVVGCSTSTTVTSSAPPVARKQPTYVSFVNLTSEATDVKVDGATIVQSLGPNEASEGFITSLKDHKVSGLAGSKTFDGTFKGEPGSFVTVVIKSEGGKLVGKALKGTSSITPSDGANLAFINLSDRAIKFSVGSDKQEVKPEACSLLQGSSGAKSVGIEGAGSVDLDTHDKEIWGVFCITKGGKLSSTSVRLKGPQKVAGASTASS